MSKASTYSEVDAMRDVDAALSQLESDARHRVMHWALSKHGVEGTADPSRTEVSARISGGDAHRPKDIKSFISTKRPDSFYERVACLVYYLEKFAGQAEVGTNDITKANSDARLSKLTNPAVFVKHATHTYGYLISLGKRKFAISARGEAVVEALPDRAKVEETHSRIPFGRKPRKSAKK
jgi:hypothetical protein